MPRRFTMSTIVTRCKQRADKEGDDHVSEWKSLISEQYGELFTTVAETGLRYFEAVSTITATGAASYTEPADHLATVGMRYVANASTGERRDLAEIMVQETTLWTGLTGEARAFALVDDQIYLYPKPSSGMYELVYVPQPPDLSTYGDADVVDVVNPDGEAFLVWGVALKALAKSQHDVMLAMRERDAAKERLAFWAAQRALNQPRRRPDLLMGSVDDPGGWWQR